MGRNENFQILPHSSLTLFLISHLSPHPPSIKNLKSNSRFSISIPNLSPISSRSPSMAAASESGAEGEGMRSFLEQLQSSFVSSVIVGLMGPSPDAAPDRVVLVNPVTQGMIVMSGGAAMFSEILGGGGGAPPASKASIEALKAVEVDGEAEEECSVCLEALSKEVVKEMPCKHRFHGGCIEKWLRMHGSCPMCRFQMPMEEVEGVKKGEGDEGARRRERVWVTIAVRREPREGDGDDSDEHGQREA